MLSKPSEYSFLHHFEHGEYSLTVLASKLLISAICPIRFDLIKFSRKLVTLGSYLAIWDGTTRYDQLNLSTTDYTPFV